MDAWVHLSGGLLGLRFDPMGGGQFKQLVAKMIEAEKEPIRNLERRKAKIETKLKLFQEFKGKMMALKGEVSNVSDFRQLRELKVDLGDGATQVSVTVDPKTARPGSYQIEIEELAQRSSMITNNFEDPREATLGMGFVVVDTPDGDFEIFVDEQNASLRGIAKAINDRRDAPVVAEVIQDAFDPEAPWRMIIKSKADGFDNETYFPELYFLGGTEDIWIDDNRDAQNALLFVDGYEIEAAGNEAPNFFEGVNLQLKEARPGRPFTLTITMDYEQVSGKIKGLVDSMNEVLRFINMQNQVGADSDTSASFTGDTGLQSIEFRLRNLMHEAFPVWDQATEEYRLFHLNTIGLELNRAGELTFDTDKFQQQLEEDYDGVSEAISGEFGFAFQLGEVLKMFTRPLDGMLATRDAGLRARIKSIDKDIMNKERLVDQRARALTDKFAKLQGVLGSLQQQQQFLQANLGGGGGLSSLLG